MSEESAPKSSKECDQLVDQYVEITNTNSAEAIMHLQEVDWDLQKALEAFFAQTPAASSSEDKVVKESSKATTSAQTLDVDPHAIKLLSWNLDGLDDVSLVTRTKAAIGEIRKEKPDVIYLQEVVPRSWELLQDLAKDYELYPAGETGYFTAMMMNKATVWVDDKSIKPFYSSVMLRKLQIVHANIKGVDFKLMTTHLESTRQHAVERSRQLQICLTEVKLANAGTNVLFGGDLNLTAADVKNVEFPADVVDFWETTGARKEAQYTWDMMRNDNKQMSGRSKPRCRFDRIYFRPSSLKNVKPTYFELCGIERVPNCSRFISDHWGLICRLAIKK